MIAFCNLLLIALPFNYKDGLLAHMLSNSVITTVLNWPIAEYNLFVSLFCSFFQWWKYFTYFASKTYAIYQRKLLLVAFLLNLSSYDYFLYSFVACHSKMNVFPKDCLSKLQCHLETFNCLQSFFQAF